MLCQKQSTKAKQVKYKNKTKLKKKRQTTVYKTLH